jgi:hypothetical protein
MTQEFTDVRSNPKDQVAHAATVLGRAKQRARVFAAIHSGRQRVKTAAQIARMTGLSVKRVLEEGRRLFHGKVVSQTKVGKEVAYERDSYFYSRLNQILALAKNPTRLASFPTKTNPSGTSKTTVIRVSASKGSVKTRIITISDIDSFSKVRGTRSGAAELLMKEEDFKRGLQAIIGEPGRFKDWGGESSDLTTTRLVFKGRRTATAMALKGRGMTGILTPGKMGTNGDQIQRLFTEDAEVFLVQYVRQIAATVPQQMAALAQAKSLTTGRTIYYGVIDGSDSARLVAAYPNKFKVKKPKRR